MLGTDEASACVAVSLHPENPEIAPQVPTASDPHVAGDKRLLMGKSWRRAE